VGVMKFRREMGERFLVSEGPRTPGGKALQRPRTARPFIIGVEIKDNKRKNLDTGQERLGKK